MRKAAKIIVKGTVHGVFFRRFVKGHADDLKLKGLCRNLDDGNVEIIVEGEPEQIKRLIGFVEKGPAHAQIRGVDVSERKWEGDFTDFRTLRF
ncbi:MAG: acylphosphatase [Nanoarchaeota archaeon]|nr:acylphosphatase [Nanoarchaeota archaeon]